MPKEAVVQEVFLILCNIEPIYSSIAMKRHPVEDREFTSNRGGISLSMMRIPGPEYDELIAHGSSRYNFLPTSKNPDCQLTSN